MKGNMLKRAKMYGIIMKTCRIKDCFRNGALVEEMLPQVLEQKSIRF